MTTLTRALAPLALMALIFVLSAQPGLDSGLGLVDDIGRKVAHAISYAALTLLWAWALRPVIPNPLLPAALIALGYAISDEYHQSFVADRNGRPLDVAIDAIGIIGVLLLYRYDPRVRSVLEGEEP